MCDWAVVPAIEKFSRFWLGRVMLDHEREHIGGDHDTDQIWRTTGWKHASTLTFDDASDDLGLGLARGVLAPWVSLEMLTS
jgi:hypothetical protein